MDIKEIEKKLKILDEEKDNLLKILDVSQDSFLNKYEIRPAARHLITIGKDLIQDPYAAIVELVKNCYDADSNEAKIIFKKIPEDDCLEIRIEDSGCGMSTKDVINKWLVPSTDNKIKNKVTAKGRKVQGRKGIGRYATSILGDDLKLSTVDDKGQKTTVFISWIEFAKYEYLDQIRVPIVSEITQEKSGTVLIMHSKLSENNYWDDKKFDKLKFELKRLIPPKIEGIEDTDFKIWLTFDNFFEEIDKNVTEEIFPYPILDLYDYRISGYINADGTNNFLYENNKLNSISKENITIKKNNTNCGKLIMDIRVYDRDKFSIEQLVIRGQKNNNIGYLSNLQVRQLLNDLNGIGVYRNGFRIRPLGDADFDWLKLNERRIQTPSRKISSNQVIGYVHIESEELSGLEEKSARDGLKNNFEYNNLVEITLAVINELEQRRYLFRRKNDLVKPKKKVEKQLNFLMDNSKLKNSIVNLLKEEKMSDETINTVLDIISKDEEKKVETINDIQTAIAVYQGQATLGKIINVVLHEGRRPLNYFKNQIPNLNEYLDIFIKRQDDKSKERIYKIGEKIEEQAESLVSLFARLDPLASKKREIKQNFVLKTVIQNSIDIFSETLKKENISVNLICDDKIKFSGWRQDINTIFVNLIDNSIYWICEKNTEERIINIIVNQDDDVLIIDYSDSGPGIDKNLLEDDIIFEPQFTTKTDGTGIGLSIAGEAAIRNQLKLTAEECNNGAHFKLIKE